MNNSHDIEDIESRPAVVVDAPEPPVPELSERDKVISAMLSGPFLSPLTQRLNGTVVHTMFTPIFLSWTSGVNYTSGVVRGLPSSFSASIDDQHHTVHVQLVSDVLLATALVDANGEQKGFASHLAAVVDNAVLNGHLPIVDTQVLPSLQTFGHFLDASLTTCGFTLILLCRENDLVTLEPYVRSLLELTRDMKRPVTVRALFVKNPEEQSTIVTEAEALTRILLDTFEKEFGLMIPTPK